MSIPGGRVGTTLLTTLGALFFLISTSGQAKGQSFWWQPVWEMASIFAEFEEVEKEISLSLAGGEVSQIPCFFVGLPWSLDDPARTVTEGSPPQGSGFKGNLEGERGVGMAGNSWAE